MTKTIFLLNIDDFEPEITRITYPFIRHYAERIGASIHIITDRKFPEWPVTYEKLQIYELAKEIGSDWNIYIDSDTLIHPECPDFTIYLPMATVSFHRPDLSTTRFKTDDYFLRDGRHMSPGNWFTIGSKLCLDLWRPLEVSPREAIAQITVSSDEKLRGIQREHLVDDYALAQNMARFGLRFKSIVDICKEQNFAEHLQHDYRWKPEEKAALLQKQIETWGIGHYGVLHAN